MGNLKKIKKYYIYNKNVGCRKNSFLVARSFDKKGWNMDACSCTLVKIDKGTNPNKIS